jgi:class 3 adenylate cyclase
VIIGTFGDDLTAVYCTISAARGISVHRAARVAAEAWPGEVLVRATTRDLIAGFGHSSPPT